MAFSENLQTLRAQAGVTQEQLAETLGVSRQSVSKWEGGLSFPELDTILRICDLYEVIWTPCSGAAWPTAWWATPPVTTPL